MSPTIVDIARNTGVSKASVSRALNGKTGVRERTRKKILEEAKNAGYLPNSLARGLVSNRTKTIGLVIPDITNPFFPEVARGIEEISREYGYNLILCNSNWDEAQERNCLESLFQNRIEGLIIEPCSKSNVSYIEKSGVPTVYLNTKVKTGDNNIISLDNVRAAYIATEYLILCGYNQIAFVGGNSKSYSNIGRLKGYKDALNEYGLKRVSSFVNSGGFDITSGYEIAKRLFTSGRSPDAVFCANDIIALGVMQYVQEHNIKIPDRVGLIGIDDIYTSDLPQVQLTTVSIPKRLMGEKSFKLLLNKFHGIQPHSEDLVVHPHLVVRKTTRVRQEKV